MDPVTIGFLCSASVSAGINVINYGSSVWTRIRRKIRLWRCKKIIITKIENIGTFHQICRILHAGHQCYDHLTQITFSSGARTERYFIPEVNTEVQYLIKNQTGQPSGFLWINPVSLDQLHIHGFEIIVKLKCQSILTAFLSQIHSEVSPPISNLDLEKS